jgi:hypothetical protein
MSSLGAYAQNIMLALKKCDVDLVFRHIDNGKGVGAKTHPLLCPIETESLQGCTHCIQFLQPEYMLGTRKFEKNIGMVLDCNEDVNNILCMDEIWVFNNQSKDFLVSKIPEAKIRVIDPVLLDIKDKLQYSYDNCDVVDFDRFSLKSVGSTIKEMLSA